MRRGSRFLAGAIAVLLLLSCSQGTTEEKAHLPIPRGPLESVSELGTIRHEFRTKEFFETPEGRPSTTGIAYHGGVVIAAPNVAKVVAIYWGARPIYPGQPAGAGAGERDGSLIGSFLRSVGGSPYFDINTTYHDGAGARVLNRLEYTSYWTTGRDVAGPAAAPTDRDIIAIIQRGLDLGRIAYDPSTVYAVFTGAGINLGGGFGSRYCAYHTHGLTSQGVAYYVAMPRGVDFPSCTAGLPSPNADGAGNAEVNILAHEIEETMTDARGDAWYDDRGYESADKCAWTWGTRSTSANGGAYNMRLSDGRFYLVQQNWVNERSGGCASALEER